MGGGGGWGKGGKTWQSAFKRTMNVVNKTEPSKKIFINGIPEGIGWKELLKHFEDAGYKPKMAEVFKDGKGGVCTFETEEQTLAATNALSGSLLGGAAIYIEAWQEKPKDPNKPAKKGWGK